MFQSLFKEDGSKSIFCPGLHKFDSKQFISIPSHTDPALPVPLLQDECHQLQDQKTFSLEGK